MIKLSDLIWEGKQVGVLYHLLNFPKMEFVLETNMLRTWNFYEGISTTRDSKMNDYLGSGELIVFKLKLDGDKLSQKYKITPFSYTSSTGVGFNEYEELIRTPKIPNIDKYIIEVIVLKDNLKRLRSYHDPTNQRSIEKWIVREKILKELPTLGKVVYQ